MELPPYTVREYEPGDEVGILETFNRVFAEVDPGFVPRSMETWNWLYRQNPSGWRIYVAITDEGEVMSQYSGIAQRMILEGGPAYFSQALDSMTDPKYRRGLKRPGFFVLTGYPYAANYGGAPPDKDVVMWGYPVPQAWRIGKSFLKYEIVRTQNKLVREPQKILLGAAPGTEVESVNEFPEAVDAFFDSCSKEHGAIAVRDKAQLDWRYVDNPLHEYSIGVARRAGEIVGFAVFRVGTFDGDEDGLLCDWLVKRGDRRAAEALLAWTVERAEEAQCERVTAVFPDTIDEWLFFQNAGFRVRPTRYFIIGRNYVKKYNMPWLHSNWFYTLGDSDLC